MLFLLQSPLFAQLKNLDGVTLPSTDPNKYQLKTQSGMPDIDSFTTQDIQASADSYEYVGANLIARGHVVIRAKNLQITGDSAVINLATNDAEVVGNVIFSAEVSETKTIDLKEYEDYISDPAIKVTVKNIVTTPTGKQRLNVELKTNAAYLSAERVSGNLETGALQFRKFMIKAAMLYTYGDLAERFPDGKIKIYGAKSSTCEYLLDSNAHYSIGAREMTLRPREANRGIFNYNPDQGEHSILARNTLFRIWDVPVLWFPALYKPADSNSFGGRIEFGKSSDWGFYIRGRKEFDVLEEPAVVRGAALVDFYSERGVGFGASLDIITPESKTEFFMYTLRDRKPYNYFEDEFGDVPDPVDPEGERISETEWIKMNSRLFIPKNRYEFRLSNLTHLTPRLDFRGQVDVISDYNFLEEFFEARYNENIQPPTFAALEYQGDRFSATAQVLAKVNSFDSMLERLPELRLDFQRQELFKNIYYQGQTSFGYYNMNWRRYDVGRDENPNLNFASIVSAAGSPTGSAEILAAYNAGTLSTRQTADALRRLDPAFDGYFEDPKNYYSARFDTLHALYYPIRLFDAVNFIPRAAGRLTAYSNSTKNKVTVEDLYNILALNTIDGWPDQNINVRNYDRKGGAKFRFAMELGAELNTKFYRAWQSPKSAFWEIDGLRHVMVPYINYTFIPRPTVSYEKLYYFDDVDQIEQQNFFRFGLINRLQTRRDSRIQEWFSLENYWDFHFDRAHGFNSIGDFTTILKFTPFDGLTLKSTLVLDIGSNNEHEYEVMRGDNNVGRPGLSSKLINRWETELTYSFSKDWKISASYFYSDAYQQRTAYSMASTLSNVNATTNFTAYFERHQYASVALDFPSIIDKRLKGRFSIRYDVDDDLIDDASLTLTRDFHCWYAQVGLGVQFDRNSEFRRCWEGYIGFAVGLSAMPGAAMASRQSLESYNNDD